MDDSHNASSEERDSDEILLDDSNIGSCANFVKT